MITVQTSYLNEEMMLVHLSTQKPIKIGILAVDLHNTREQLVPIWRGISICDVMVGWPVSDSDHAQDAGTSNASQNLGRG